MMRIYLISILLLLLAQLSVSAQVKGNKIKISKDIELVKLSDKAYIHTSYFQTESYGRVGANGLLLVDDGKAFLFDSPWNDEQTETLATWLSNSLNVVITDFVPTHYHEDCMGGIGYLHSQDVESHANQMTIDIAKEKGLPTPLSGIEGTRFMKLNDIDVFCYYLGGGHTEDNIVVWIPSEKILFGGCLVKDLQSKSLGNVAEANLEEWPNTIDNVIEKFPSAEIIIPGHGQYGGKELLVHTKELLSSAN